MFVPNKNFHLLLVLLFAIQTLTACTKSFDKFWQNRQIGEYEKIAKEGTDLINSAIDDATRAKGFSTRAQGLSEKARYSRFLKLLSTEEYEKIFNEAIKDSNQALALAPTNSDHYYKRGRVYYARAFQGDPMAPPELSYGKLALSDFSAAVEKNSKHVEALDFLGITKMALGNINSAIEDFEKLREIESRLGSLRLADALCTRGNSFQKENKNEQAIQDYERSIAVYSSRDGCSCDPYGPLKYLKTK